MIRPQADRLVVEPMPRVQSSVIEVVSNEKACIGKVVAAGKGKYDKKGRLMPLDVKVGQTVRYGGEDYLSFPEYFDPQTLKTYHIIQEADVVGICH